MKIALTTGNQAHHKFIANEIFGQYSEYLKLVIIQENYNSKNVENKPSIKKNIFSKLLSKQLKFVNYGSKSLSFNNNINSFRTQNINDVEKTIELLKIYEIELLILIGGKVINKEIIEYLDGNVINIHNGYSPYYKGSNTLFLPILNSDFDKIGITVHYATDQVDSGRVIFQKRLNSFKYFNYDLLFIKSMKLSRDSIFLVLDIILNNFALPAITHQDKVDKVYLSKNFTQQIESEIRVIIFKNFINFYLR